DLEKMTIEWEEMVFLTKAAEEEEEEADSAIVGAQRMATVGIKVINKMVKLIDDNDEDDKEKVNPHFAIFLRRRKMADKSLA
ncbi:hypothetical protein U1Q18_041176, partial [Sarracenia purpurea var. burkii]